MMTALPKRSQGSHDPDTRSGSPSGLCVVALITAAAAAAMISGNMTEYTPLAGVQRSATRSPTATPARASRLAGTRRLTRCRPASLIVVVKSSSSRTSEGTIALSIAPGPGRVHRSMPIPSQHDA